jgi:hypothetical protein
VGNAGIPHSAGRVSTCFIPQVQITYRGYVLRPFSFLSEFDGMGRIRWIDVMFVIPVGRSTIICQQRRLVGTLADDYSAPDKRFVIVSGSQFVIAMCPATTDFLNGDL